MNKSNSHGIRQIVIRRSTVESMLSTMREFGSHGWEVLVLWLGEVDQDNRSATVVHAVVPKQNPISSEDGVGYFVAGETLFQLNRNLSESGLRLIAQVHSHPQDAYHSEADDRYAIVTSNGGLSIVVPDFGNVAANPLLWAVYRLNNRDWEELSEDDVRGLFILRD